MEAFGSIVNPCNSFITGRWFVKMTMAWWYDFIVFGSWISLMYAFIIIWSNYNLNEKIHKDIILDMSCNLRTYVYLRAIVLIGEYFCASGYF